MAASANIPAKPKVRFRAKKQSTRIDMTPMVDLAFLLLTFFILTTTLAEQKTVDLVMPDDNTIIDTKPVNNSLTVILSKNDEVYYYEDELKPETVLKETNFKAIRNVLMEKNKPVIEALKQYTAENRGHHLSDSLRAEAIKELHNTKGGAFVIIKYDSLAKYRNTIDMVDEMGICSIPPGKYAIVKKLEAMEKVMLKQYR